MYCTSFYKIQFHLCISNMIALFVHFLNGWLCIFLSSYGKMHIFVKVWCDDDEMFISLCSLFEILGVIVTIGWFSSPSLSLLTSINRLLIHTRFYATASMCVDVIFTRRATMVTDFYLFKQKHIYLKRYDTKIDDIAYNTRIRFI